MASICVIWLLYVSCGFYMCHVDSKCVQGALIEPLHFHSPVAKSPLGTTVPFLQNLQCCGVVCGGLAGMFAGMNPARFDPVKDSAK